MKHSRITTAEDNQGKPVFWQTPSYVLAVPVFVMVAWLFYFAS